MLFIYYFLWLLIYSVLNVLLVLYKFFNLNFFFKNSVLLTTLPVKWLQSLFFFSNETFLNLGLNKAVYQLHNNFLTKSVVTEQVNRFFFYFIFFKNKKVINFKNYNIFLNLCSNNFNLQNTQSILLALILYFFKNEQIKTSYIQNLNFFAHWWLQFNTKILKVSEVATIIKKDTIKKYKELQFIEKFVGLQNSFLVVVSNNLFTQKWAIRFNTTNALLNLNSASVANQLIYFLRKNKSFIKGRYARNRQYYRTGVYWCIWINILAIVAFYYWFYRLMFNFTYLWWFFFSLVASFVFSKFIKQNSFSFLNFKVSFFKNFFWLFMILNSLYTSAISLFTLIFNYFKLHTQLITLNFFFLNNTVVLYLATFFINLFNFFKTKLQPVFIFNYKGQPQVLQYFNFFFK